jgi:subtilisin family serine protease
LDESYQWYDPSDDHGTSVFGIIGASYNAGGVVGVGGGTGGICYIVARVFSNVEEEAFLSDILTGVMWAVLDQGANIINLSLGGPSSTLTGKNFYERMWNELNVIPIAASGNGGTGDYSYPASYTEVVSVGAVREDLLRADFSQYNDMVR